MKLTSVWNILHDTHWAILVTLFNFQLKYRMQTGYKGEILSILSLTTACSVYWVDSPSPIKINEDDVIKTSLI